MAISVIGAGFGRTATMSLKLALEQLGFGPCHHMEEVLHNRPTQLPLWEAALRGDADWAAVYEGYPSAVDWPTAGFFRELSTAFPDAKFVLSTRTSESSVMSCSRDMTLTVPVSRMVSSSKGGGLSLMVRNACCSSLLSKIAYPPSGLASVPVN